MQVNNLFVVAMGLGTVFVVLVLIVGLCYLLGTLFRSTKVEEKKAEAIAPAAPVQNRAELAAAIAAAIAEFSGTDASAIRILSIKKI